MNKKIKPLILKLENNTKKRGFMNIVSTEKRFSVNSGLVIFDKLIKKTGLLSIVEPILSNLSSPSKTSCIKFNNLIHGFISGADCLEDMDTLHKDVGFDELITNNSYTSKTYGNFLRAFTQHDCTRLNQALIEYAFTLRDKFTTPDDKSPLIFDCDSTSNLQYGKKMEGVEMNKDGIMCLDTIQVFDELGIQYWSDVRKGATFSANGVSAIIHAILSRVPKTKKYKNKKKIFRADSAFCNTEFFNACSGTDKRFVTSMRENMLNPILKTFTHWTTQNPNKKTRIMFYDGRECEISQSLYHPKEGAETLRVVCIRAFKENCKGMMFIDEECYDYHAWVTNMGSNEIGAEDLIRFYRKRGNSENFIRELKYGYDLKHYPCLKLLANKAYGIIAAFSHNLMRYMSLKINFKKPMYAKRLRRLLVYLPAQIVKHAGKISFVFMNHHYKEVKRLLDELQLEHYGFA